MAAAALTCRTDGAETRWLVRWNRGWECFFLVGGHKLDAETFRDCLVREIAEELGLSEGQDYAMGSAPLAHVTYAAKSRRTGEDTRYAVELFAVRLASDAVWDRIAADARVRLVTEAEIRSQRCGDGKPISPTMLRLLDSVGWKCPEA